MNIKLNGSSVSAPDVRMQPVPERRQERGRDLADAAIRLRVYLATELRRQCEAEGLDADHYGSAAVTSIAIALEKQGLRGIKKESTNA